MMNTRSIYKEWLIERDIDSVFQYLVLPSKIKQWWSAQSAIILPERGGLYIVSWGKDEDDPDYISSATIVEIDPPGKLSLSYERYYTKFGRLPFEANLEVEFTLMKQGESTKLALQQTGFPNDTIADEFYAGCIQGWEDTITAFKNLLENE